FEGERNPEVGLLRIRERAWGDADDRVFVSVDRDVAADDVRVGGKFAAPQLVRQHHDTLRAVCVFAGDEATPELHANAEQLEEARADGRGIQPLRVRAYDRQVRAVAILDLSDGNEAVRLIAVVDEVRNGERRQLAVAILRSDSNELVRISEGKRL